MEKVNYHTHTAGSDGKLEPEALVKLAIEKGFDVLGITDHYFFPAGFRDWGNDCYSEAHYLELLRLREKYKDKIKIMVNVEFDWLEGYEEWVKKEASRREYDLKYISVHFLKIGDEHFPFEHSEELFEEMIEKAGGVRKLIEIYYGGLREGIGTGCFDVASHLDLIKFWNEDSKYFNEDEGWYREEVLRTLELIREKGMKIDLNLKGLRKPCGEAYPSGWIVEECERLGIGVLVGTDAHCAEELEMGLDECKELATY